MTSPPPIHYYEGFAVQNGQKQYLGLTPAVGPHQARSRILADWKKAAPRLIEDITAGKVRMIVRRTRIKRAIKQADNMLSQPMGTGIFKVPGDRTLIRFELSKRNRGE